MKNLTYQVAELFLSINGEGMKAGELAVFVRMKGCNLSCAYCDTAWANTKDASYTEMTAEEIVAWVKKEQVCNVTLTGGEPLLQPGIETLLCALAKAGFRVEIETNGSVDLTSYRHISDKIVFTMDYKLAGSGMENAMRVENFSLLRGEDTVKFVVSDRADLERAYAITGQYLEKSSCQVLLSPVFGRIAPEDIVEFMKERRFSRARLQIQLHKVIWNPQKRGV